MSRFDMHRLRVQLLAFIPTQLTEVLKTLQMKADSLQTPKDSKALDQADQDRTDVICVTLNIA